MDVYKLINSKAIENHCRDLNHEFNLLEIAVLIYRNRSISVDKKIKLYSELLEKYEDMPMMEHYGCNEKSVKQIIKNEVDRLKLLKVRFTKEEKGYLYKEVTFWHRSGYIEKDNYIKDTYLEVYDRITNDINEERDSESDFSDYLKNDNISEFKIIKWNYNRNEDKEELHEIIAYYNVIDKLPVLYNIDDDKEVFPLLGNLFIYIPTPFKQGDLLCSNNHCPFDRGLVSDAENIFVLEDMKTWKEDALILSRKGKCGDSSDMMGYGYYIDQNDINFEVCWDYDFWEYYNGKFEEMQRLLKGISEFYKGNVQSLELLFAVYNKMKIESIEKNMFLGLRRFTKEGLKLSGFNSKDLKKMDIINELSGL